MCGVGVKACAWRRVPVLARFGAFDFAATAAEITRLMGRGEAAARCKLMELHGDAVEVDV